MGYEADRIVDLIKNAPLAYAVKFEGRIIDIGFNRGVLEMEYEYNKDIEIVPVKILEEEE